jgi:hypothetical protein
LGAQLVPKRFRARVAHYSRWLWLLKFRHQFRQFEFTYSLPTNVTFQRLSGEMREVRPYMGIFLPTGTGESRSRSIGGLTRRVICGRE